MMDTDLIAVERKLDRVKRLLDAEIMIDVLAGLLVSKGIITDSELVSETARVKSRNMILIYTKQKRTSRCFV